MPDLTPTRVSAIGLDVSKNPSSAQNGGTPAVMPACRAHARWWRGGQRTASRDANQLARLRPGPGSPRRAVEGPLPATPHWPCERARASIRLLCSCICIAPSAPTAQLRSAAAAAISSGAVTGRDGQREPAEVKTSPATLAEPQTASLLACISLAPPQYQPRVAVRLSWEAILCTAQLCQKAVGKSIERRD